MPQADTFQPGMRSDPLADAAAALQSAFSAAQAFNNFAALLNELSDVLTTKQDETLTTLSTETALALSRINAARDAAIEQIVNVADRLDRRAQHNQVPLSGQAVAVP
jgi:outer membrane receptor protein involved in Fe transport